MREHKYRAKRLDNGEWVYGGIWVNKTNGRITVYIIDEYGDSHAVSQEAVGQYTGLNDCKRTKEYPNGEEIYEKDILKSDDKYSKVWWDDGAFWVDFEGNSMQLLIDSLIGVEKVGNVYTNPEMVEGAK